MSTVRVSSETQLPARVRGIREQRGRREIHPDTGWRLVRTVEALKETSRPVPPSFPGSAVLSPSRSSVAASLPFPPLLRRAVVPRHTVALRALFGRSGTRRLQAGKIAAPFIVGCSEAGVHSAQRRKGIPSVVYARPVGCFRLWPEVLSGRKKIKGHCLCVIHILSDIFANAHGRFPLTQPMGSSG